MKPSIRRSTKFSTPSTDRKADAGLIIHEAQLTYAKAGFHNVIDLGRWFKDTYDLPLPLGANALRRDLQSGNGQRVLPPDAR